MFATQVDDSTPSLQPWDGGTGFPTIGDVLNQGLPINCDGSGGTSRPYDTAWIGKWHVSDFNYSGAGARGPIDYGFNSIFCIPTPYNGIAGSGYFTSYQSPNGEQNEGSHGDELSNAFAHNAWTEPFGYNVAATPADPDC